MRAADEVIGYCGLCEYPVLDGRREFELGYRLAGVVHGRGYATEAARGVLAHAFDSLALERVVSLVDPMNAASLRVAEKLGMRFEKAVMLPGYDHPDHLYVATRSARG